MELPTYTNIWRIEKRLYKLYDFRLPMPLPLGQIAVFTAIVVPYVVVLALLGVPFSHTLLWLYVLPPGVLTWLATRPVLESKRLPELVASQLRYLGEPRTWCRMAPLAEKDEVVVAARVWRQRRLVDAAGPDLPVAGKDTASGEDAGQDGGDGDEVSRRPEAPSALPSIRPPRLAVTGGTERVAAATAALAGHLNGRNGSGRAHDDPAAGQRALQRPQAGGPHAGRPQAGQAASQAAGPAADHRRAAGAPPAAGSGSSAGPGLAAGHRCAAQPDPAAANGRAAGTASSAGPGQGAGHRIAANPIAANPASGAGGFRAAGPGPAGGFRCAAGPGPAGGFRCAAGPGPAGGFRCAAGPGPAGGFRCAAGPGPAGGFRCAAGPGPPGGPRYTAGPGPAGGFRCAAGGPAGPARKPPLYRRARPGRRLPRRRKLRFRRRPGRS